jgi:hypothetical protein
VYIFTGPSSLSNAYAVKTQKIIRSFSSSPKLERSHLSPMSV